MIPGLGQTDREVLADLKGSRTLEVILKIVEKGQEQAASELKRGCLRSMNTDGLARTWATWGNVLDLIRGAVIGAAEENDQG